MNDNITESTANDAGASAPPVSRRARSGRRAAVVNARAAETLRQQAADVDDHAARRVTEDAATLARMAESAGEPTETATDGDGLDLTPDEYERAAEAIVDGAEAQPDEDADDAPQTPEWSDAFRPPTVNPENPEEPEISGRDQRYREQLRAVEADRDRLHGLVEAMQRAEIGRLVSPSRLSDPEDLFHGGAELADLLDDDGGIDPARVDRAVNEVLAQHPHWASPRRAYRGELRSGATERAIEPKGNRWSDAFAPSTSEST